MGAETPFEEELDSTAATPLSVALLSFFRVPLVSLLYKVLLAYARKILQRQLAMCTSYTITDVNTNTVNLYSHSCI